MHKTERRVDLARRQGQRSRLSAGMTQGPGYPRPEVPVGHGSITAAKPAWG